MSLNSGFKSYSFESEKLNAMNKVKRYSTDFLFSMPSFLVGVGSVMNIAGNYFDFSSSDNDADTKAILSDWGVVGQDILQAIEELEKESESTRIESNEQPTQKVKRWWQ